MRLGWLKLGASRLNTSQSALTAFPDATHFHLISDTGNCMPIKPIGFAHDFLSIQDVDYIESTGPERKPPDLLALFQSTHSNTPI